jgi:hypothetical protein
MLDDKNKETFGVDSENLKKVKVTRSMVYECLDDEKDQILKNKFSFEYLN